MANLFIQAKKRLEAIEFIKCIDLGNDNQGNFYILVYGYKYPNQKGEKAREKRDSIEKDFFQIIDHLLQKNTRCSIVYFQSRLSATAKGGIPLMKLLYQRLPRDKHSLFISLLIIHPNFYLKTKVFFKSIFSERHLMRKIRMYDTLAAFLEDPQREVPADERKKDLISVPESNLKLNKQIIGSLPAEIFEIYQHEYDHVQTKKKSKTNHHKTSSDTSLTKHTTNLENLTFDELKFSNSPRDQQLSVTHLSTHLEWTQDVVGKHLHEFQRQAENDVPEIFILLVSFFEVNPELFHTKNIFVQGCAQEKLDELQVHMSLGDYYFLTEVVKEPHVVANFLKRVLNSMREPLCTYNLYYQFRDLLEEKEETLEQRKKRLQDICSQLPLLNRNTLIFLISFFMKVIEQSVLNNMDLHKLSTVVTPNIFRPEQATHNDLIYAGKLVQMFKLMMENYKFIFCVRENEDEGDMVAYFPGVQKEEEVLQF